MLVPDGCVHGRHDHGNCSHWMWDYWFPLCATRSRWRSLFAPLLHYGLNWEIDGALLIVSLGLSATSHLVRDCDIEKKVTFLMIH